MREISGLEDNGQLYVYLHGVVDTVVQINYSESTEIPRPKQTPLGRCAVEAGHNETLSAA